MARVVETVKVPWYRTEQFKEDCKSAIWAFVDKHKLDQTRGSEGFITGIIPPADPELYRQYRYLRLRLFWTDWVNDIVPESLDVFLREEE